MSLSILKWDKKFSVNFKLIDEQHKQLFELYNRIVKLKKQDSVRGGQLSSEAIDQVLKELSDYVQVHFRTEEEVMKTYGYEPFEAHKKSHDDFASLIKELSNDYAKGQLILLDTFIKMIHSWLVHHIQVEDQKYKHLLN